MVRGVVCGKVFVKELSFSSSTRLYAQIDIHSFVSISCPFHFPLVLHLVEIRK